MEQEKDTALYKETFFDRVFRPQVITLENGHTVRRRRSRTPLILLILALVIFWALRMTGFSLATIVNRFPKLLDLMKISRRTLSIVRQNIVFALGVKLAVLILSALGLCGMWAAVFADVGVSIIAILNSMRALKIK